VDLHTIMNNLGTFHIFPQGCGQYHQDCGFFVDKLWINCGQFVENLWMNCKM